MISSFFAVCHGLNDKGLRDFEKRMIISKLLGGGGGGLLWLAFCCKIQQCIFAFKFIHLACNSILNNYIQASLYSYSTISTYNTPANRLKQNKYIWRLSTR